MHLFHGLNAARLEERNVVADRTTFRIRRFPVEQRVVLEDLQAGFVSLEFEISGATEGSFAMVDDLHIQ